MRRLLTGEYPQTLNATRLLRRMPLPLNSKEQRKVLGMRD